MLTAAQILSDLRSRTVAEDVRSYAAIPLLESDPILMRLASSWMWVNVPKDPNPNELCPELTPINKRVRWLWARLEPDPVTDWLDISGLPDAPHTRRACYVLIDNGVVLPDGTLAKFAEMYIRRKVGTYLANMMPRRPGPAPPQPREERDAR